MLALAYMYTMRHQELAVRPYEANRRATGPWHDSTRLRDSTHCAIVSRRNKGDNASILRSIAVAVLAKPHAVPEY